MLEVCAVETKTSQRNVIAESRRRLVAQVLAGDLEPPATVGGVVSNDPVDQAVGLLGLGARVAEAELEDPKLTAIDLHSQPTRLVELLGGLRGQRPGGQRGLDQRVRPCAADDQASAATTRSPLVTRYFSCSPTGWV